MRLLKILLVVLYINTILYLGSWLKWHSYPFKPLKLSRCGASKHFYIDRKM